jgi:hypothetical protein
MADKLFPKPKSLFEGGAAFLRLGGASYVLVIPKRLVACIRQPADWAIGFFIPPLRYSK